MVLILTFSLIINSMEKILVSRWNAAVTTLFLFISSLAFGQGNLIKLGPVYNTTWGAGWNCYVKLPANYDAGKKYKTIIFFPGTGETGTNSAALVTYGPNAYAKSGWAGTVDTVSFILVSIQPINLYPNEALINSRLIELKKLYPAIGDIYLTGLSMGGWCSTTFVTGDPLGGPYYYASQIKAVVDVQGVMPDDNSPYPNLFDNFALSGGKLLSLEQAFDNRGAPTRVNRMNATKPGSAVYIQTKFGSGGHCCWNEIYGNIGIQPAKFLIDGKSQNIYEWIAGIQATVVVPDPPGPVIKVVYELLSDSTWRVKK
jgi:hypothetical protein